MSVMKSVEWHELRFWFFFFFPDKVFSSAKTSGSVLTCLVSLL